ncbi:type II toxin-antitoxin system RelE/ParE family toxin [Brevundimonas balnearis]|uniref:Type II toxin-antitoxin system RelE/ParE family toxin n=1 Tax=Brevundimonas balnearis TaxID=1572858 RepID=A0ABV6R780_9CAUL
MLPTIWSATAIQDAELIVDYIAERNPVAARNVRNRLVEAAEGLGQAPYLYREGRVAGTREAVVLPNYILVYRVELAAIRVVQVLHASQRYPQT